MSKKRRQEDSYDKEEIRRKRDRNSEYKKNKKRPSSDKGVNRQRIRQEDSERSRVQEYFK